MSPKTSAEDEARIVKHVQDHPGLTAGAIGRACRMVSRTVGNILDRAEARGLVRHESVRARTRTGYARLWYAAETEQ